MLYEFKSRAAGSVIMTDSIGAQALDILGKAGSKGIFTVEQLPAAIRTLEEAIARSKAQMSSAANQPNSETDNEDAQPTVSLAARLLPLTELLQASLKADKEVTWGV